MGGCRSRILKIFLRWTKAQVIPRDTSKIPARIARHPQNVAKLPPEIATQNASTLYRIGAMWDKNW